MKKAIVIILVCMLLMVGIIIPVSGTTLLEKTSTSLTIGNILYVGGSGSNNYTKIQDAIDNTSDGDTVFVYDDSSPYLESVVINKSINLIGEDKYSTIINVQDLEGNGVTIEADKVLLCGFTIQNAYGQKAAYSGVSIQSNGSSIEDNILQYNRWAGIFVFYGDYNVIQDNIIINNTFDGINLLGRYNKIMRNYIADNKYGITLEGAFHNNFSLNTIYNHTVGIDLWDYNRNNTFYQNNITSNEIGVRSEMSSKNYILRNNFISNGKNAVFLRCPLAEIVLTLFLTVSFKDTYILKNYRAVGVSIWDGNYWDKPRLLPYPILGRRGVIGTLIKTSANTFWPNRIVFDWHPAQKPYNIPPVV